MRCQLSRCSAAPALLLSAMAMLALPEGSSASLIAAPAPNLAAPATVRMQRRVDGEHVVLCDCHDSGGNTYSSQMAYYASDPIGSPQDFAVVNANGQALWTNSKTSALFTTTGVTFTATLGPKVADGEYAGNGTNTYATFSCWQKYQQTLYNVSNTICSMVYDCDHRAMPAVTSTPVNDNKELSIGAIIGIAIGASGGALLIAAGGLYYYFRRRGLQQRARANSTRSEASSSRGGLLGMFRKHDPQPSNASGTTFPSSPYTDSTTPGSPKPPQELYTTRNNTYELDAQYRTPEMPVTPAMGAREMGIPGSPAPPAEEKKAQLET